MSDVATRRMVYDGLNLVEEYDGSGNLLRRHAHGQGFDEPIFSDEGTAMDCSGSKFPHADERGSIVALADCWGNLTSINRYDEYGVPQSTNAGRFGYTGQAWVPELGLWYYKNRMYRQDMGRFPQPDPIGYAGDGPNLYAYVLNDPVNWLDPLGLDGAVLDNPLCGSGCHVGDDGVPVVEGTPGLNDYARAGQAWYFLNRAFNFLTPQLAGRLAEAGQKCGSRSQFTEKAERAEQVATVADTAAIGFAVTGLVTAPTGVGPVAAAFGAGGTRLVSAVASGTAAFYNYRAGNYTAVGANLVGIVLGSGARAVTQRQLTRIFRGQDFGASFGQERAGKALKDIVGSTVGDASSEAICR